MRLETESLFDGLEAGSVSPAMICCLAVFYPPRDLSFLSLHKYQKHAAGVDDVAYLSVAGHFRFGDAGVAVAVFFQHLFDVLVPVLHVVGVELDHEILRPILDVIILQPKNSPTQPTIHRPAKRLGQLKPKRRIKPLRNLKVLSGHVND